jgi:hypothetical protein
MKSNRFHNRFLRNYHAGFLKASAAVIFVSLCMLHGEALAQGRPIKATLVQGLDFGIIGATDITGTATIQSNGTKIVSAGILDLGGIATPAIFRIQGERNRSFLITLPANATITMPGGPSAILGNFESSPPVSGVLDQKGNATVAVGATLNLLPSLWEGAYGSLFDIMVTYQ